MSSFEIGQYVKIKHTGKVSTVVSYAPNGWYTLKDRKKYRTSEIEPEPELKQKVVKCAVCSDICNVNNTLCDRCIIWSKTCIVCNKSTNDDNSFSFDFHIVVCDDCLDIFENDQDKYENLRHV